MADTETEKLTNLLHQLGYRVVVGEQAVREAMHDHARAGVALCSGYRIFPDGSKCRGCPDCDRGKSDG